MTTSENIPFMHSTPHLASTVTSVSETRPRTFEEWRIVYADAILEPIQNLNVRPKERAEFLARQGVIIHDYFTAADDQAIADSPYIEDEDIPFLDLGEPLLPLPTSTDQIVRPTIPGVHHRAVNVAEERWWLHHHTKAENFYRTSWMLHHKLAPNSTLPIMWNVDSGGLESWGSNAPAHSPGKSRRLTSDSTDRRAILSSSNLETLGSVYRYPHDIPPVMDRSAPPYLHDSGAVVSEEWSSPDKDKCFRTGFPRDEVIPTTWGDNQRHRHRSPLGVNPFASVCCKAAEWKRRRPA